MTRLTVVSLEQALSLPYATSRMVQLGWRVIRVEAPAGDPNRRIGAPLGGPDRCAYFVGPNVGKEAITLDLAHPQGRQALHRVIRGLEVDVFCCNTLPSRYAKLGIDEPTLRAMSPRLIWAGISAMGPEHPDVPGYDPALQAQLGYMDVTGPADGPPVLCGLPLIDLKAGDELFTQVLALLLRRERTGTGGRSDISMARAAASWLVTLVPMLDAGAPPEELTRSGSEHRHFVPSNVYPSSDGFLYLAIGSDRQWALLTSIPAFAEVADPSFVRNSGRKENRPKLHERIAACTRRRSTEQNLDDLRAAGLVCAPVLPVSQAMEEPWVRGLLHRTVAPDGRSIRLPPAAVDTGAPMEFPFAPSQGEHTERILREAGLSAEETSALLDAGAAQGLAGRERGEQVRR
ncbi:MAG: CoA transferase [Myxococcales bacterium]|nr:CoA transferase [Myxococcales bacterium]